MESFVEFANVDLRILLLPFLSYMLFDFMQDGMIFKRYGKWLETIKPISIGKYSIDIAKPLGLCLKCFHVWIVIVFSFIFGIEFSKFIISLGVSYVILVKFFYD